MVGSVVSRLVAMLADGAAAVPRKRLTMAQSGRCVTKIALPGPRVRRAPPRTRTRRAIFAPKRLPLHRRSTRPRVPAHPLPGARRDATQCRSGSARVRWGGPTQGRHRRTARRGVVRRKLPRPDCQAAKELVRRRLALVETVDLANHVGPSTIGRQVVLPVKSISIHHGETES